MSDSERSATRPRPRKRKTRSSDTDTATEAESRRQSSSARAPIDMTRIPPIRELVEDRSSTMPERIPTNSNSSAAHPPQISRVTSSTGVAAERDEDATITATSSDDGMQEDAKIKLTGGGGPTIGSADQDDERGSDNEGRAKKKRKPNASATRPSPLSRVRNAGKRGRSRSAHGKSKYSSPYGDFRLSGMPFNDQLKATTQQEDFNGVTLGPLPSYDEVGGRLSREDFGNIADGKPPAADASDKVKHAGALLHGLVMAEDFRAPGYQKFARASFRRYAETGKPEHKPMTVDNYPAMNDGGTQRARDLMAEGSKLTANHKDIAGYMSDSSDSESGSKFSSNMAIAESEEKKTAKGGNRNYYGYHEKDEDYVQPGGKK